MWLIILHRDHMFVCTLFICTVVVPCVDTVSHTVSSLSVSVSV